MRTAGNRIDLKTLLMERGSWKEMIFKIPLNPKHSVILEYLQNCWSEGIEAIQGDSDIGDFAVWCVLPRKFKRSSKDHRDLSGNFSGKNSTIKAWHKPSNLMEKGSKEVDMNWIWNWLW